MGVAHNLRRTRVEIPPRRDEYDYLSDYLGYRELRRLHASRDYTHRGPENHPQQLRNLANAVLRQGKLLSGVHSHAV